MVKKCTKCGKTKKENEFSWKNQKKGKKHSECKTCHRACENAWYQNNREKHILQVSKNNKRYLAQNREFVAEFLKQNPCTDCGETDIVKLTFDHVRGKKQFNISQALSKSFVSLGTLKEEIAKCNVRCANCHNVKTAHEQGRWILEYR